MKAIFKQKLIVVTIILAFVTGSCNSVTCDQSNEGYKSGYKIGKNSVWNTPEEYILNCNNGAGMIGEVPPCWKEGFKDARK